MELVLVWHRQPHCWESPSANAYHESLFHRSPPWDLILTTSTLPPPSFHLLFRDVHWALGGEIEYRGWAFHRHLLPALGSFEVLSQPLSTSERSFSACWEVRAGLTYGIRVWSWKRDVWRSSQEEPKRVWRDGFEKIEWIPVWREKIKFLKCRRPLDTISI